MAFYQFSCKQSIPAQQDRVWEFICRPENLKRITPAYMGFEIITPHLPKVMHPGMIIEYRLCPVAGFPVRWVTEITHVIERTYFVDEQRVGPYAMWHHEHFLEPIEGGVVMRDLVSYKPPLGIIGKAANQFFISRQVRAIFAYRRQALTEIFGQWTGA